MYGRTSNVVHDRKFIITCVKRDKDDIILLESFTLEGIGKSSGDQYRANLEESLLKVAKYLRLGLRFAFLYRTPNSNRAPFRLKCIYMLE